MSPHQHGEVGIGIVEARLASWLFTRQNSALLPVLLQLREFLYCIVEFPSPFTKANGCT